jgi:hypothetical protein
LQKNEREEQSEITPVGLRRGGEIENRAHGRNKEWVRRSNRGDEAQVMLASQARFVLFNARKSDIARRKAAKTSH